MAVAVPDPGDRAEHAVGDHLLQRPVRRKAAHEIAGLEQHARLADRFGHLPRVRRGKSERLLDEEMLARLCGGRNQRHMAVGFRTDHHRIDFRVVPEFFRFAADAAADLLRIPFGARPVMIPEGDDFDAGTFLQTLHEVRSVNMGDARQCNFFHRIFSR